MPTAPDLEFTVDELLAAALSGARGDVAFAMKCANALSALVAKGASLRPFQSRLLAGLTEVTDGDVQSLMVSALASYAHREGDEALVEAIGRTSHECLKSLLDSLAIQVDGPVPLPMMSVLATMTRDASEDGFMIGRLADVALASASHGGDIAPAVEMLLAALGTPRVGAMAASSPHHPATKAHACLVAAILAGARLTPKLEALVGESDGARRALVDLHTMQGNWTAVDALTNGSRKALTAVAHGLIDGARRRRRGINKNPNPGAAQAIVAEALSRVKRLVPMLSKVDQRAIEGRLTREARFLQ